MRSPRASRAAVATLALALLAAGCDADPPPATSPPPISPEATSPSEPPVPAFRFRVQGRHAVRSAPGGIRRRARRAVARAAEDVRSVLTDLYVEAFLDPASWRPGDYDGVFRAFAGPAASEARRRVGALTAGARAGGRFDAIQPISGTLGLRVLLNRSAEPIVVSSTVRFRARALGDDPTVLRSAGTFLLRRVRGAWRIVSFDVQRSSGEAG
jgi:hypothetical protein